MEKVWVISLGGSRIVPGDVDDKFLLKFKKMIDSHPQSKFVVVTGGGATARKYIIPGSYAPRICTPLVR